jgi:hypothetical protein
MAIFEKHTTSLEEFWGALSPLGDLANKLKKPIYRGQGSANWYLTPSVFRNNVINKYARKRDDYSRTEQVILLEFSLLHGFLYNCDEQGISVPYDCLSLRKSMDFSTFMAKHSDSTSGWPQEEFHPFLAMAQHHGIPTRLLDWSRNPLVAMYFAASQALHLDEQPELLAVWVIDAESLELESLGLQVLSIAGGVSGNLAAQKGSFMLYKEPELVDFTDDFCPKKHEAIIDKLLFESDKITAYKITLPACFAGELMLQCLKFNISATTLFPGADGAAKGVLEFKIAKRAAGIL